MLTSRPTTQGSANTRAGLELRRFCMYPQEIVLKLEQPSKIQQIQILSHEYKVN